MTIAPTRSDTSAPIGAETLLAGHRVPRVGLGAARLTAGDGWGIPADPEVPRALLRAALDAGIRYVDTADALGPGVSEGIIGDVIGNRDNVLVSTKVGMLRPAANRWGILGQPDYLRHAVHASLHRLKRERIDLLFLHRIDPNVPLEDQLGALADLRDQGKIGHIGLSEPTLDQVNAALKLEPIAAVQSLYNVAARENAPVIERLGDLGIPFIAYWPLIGRGLPADAHARVFAALEPAARAHETTVQSIALAWIFHTVPDGLAVVGSRNPAHLRDNLAATGIALSTEEVLAISAAITEAQGGLAFDPKHSPHAG
ncbi:aldo/keto reductase [Mycetocola tolaasinivorans]|uniref:Aldo/keto reductase n=1 Tax=Mycetocola tolaasinivorans TaxID=76635 RepID=A0A3L7ABG5_9MICO|nr:aldo/keto reductase [Mycetocola tolaasinivorans]RLP77836.1 aldo/keto reductase [Mycetocola tolaasinivorans]